MAEIALSTKEKIELQEAILETPPDVTAFVKAIDEEHDSLIHSKTMANVWETFDMKQSSRTAT